MQEAYEPLPPHLNTKRGDEDWRKDWRNKSLEEDTG